MRPEDIRKLYRGAGAASDDEVRRTQQRARTDPDEARRLLLTLYALAGEDRAFEALMNLVLQAATMQLIALKAHEDDTFALRVAELIVDAMEQLKPGSRVARGRQARKVRSA